MPRTSRFIHLRDILNGTQISPHRPNQLSLPFGSAIRSIRLRQGRTEAQLARSAAVERSHLSRIERDRVKTNLETVLRLLRGLGAESIFVNVIRNREK
jgi:DNA-binding XRE family transcriptional regulator